MPRSSVQASKMGDDDAKPSQIPSKDDFVREQQRESFLWLKLLEFTRISDVIIAI